ELQGGGDDRTDRQAVFLFQTNPNDHFAIPMDLVARIERVRTDQIDSIGGSDVLQYRTSTLPLVHIDKHVKCRPTESLESVYIVVFHVHEREVGLVAPVLNDIRSVPTDVDTVTFREQGIIGSLVIDRTTTRLVDLFELTELAHPEWFIDREEPVCKETGSAPRILLAEDSAFFRNQVLSVFEQNGYQVIACEDGLEAWEALQSGEHEFDVIVTDIEMPNLNGFELCRRVKESPLLKHLPVIALTSLAGTADVQHGIEVGIDDYQIKMDREKLLNSLRNFVDHGKPATAKRTKQ